MKRIPLILAIAWLWVNPFTTQAELPVIDPSVLVQAIQEVQLAIEQLNQLKTEVRRLGDPAAINLPGAAAIIESLGKKGLVKTWIELRGEATAEAAFRYDGDGLYHVIGEKITTADGQKIPRAGEDYRRFDAVTRAAAALEQVMDDTEVRRERVRGEIRSTTGQLEAATSVAEVQKLQATLSAQAAELGAIDREREAALNPLLLQYVGNQTDAEKQEHARREERIVDFQTAQEKLAQFLIPDTSPVKIPDPRLSKP